MNKRGIFLATAMAAASALTIPTSVAAQTGQKPAISQGLAPIDLVPMQRVNENERLFSRGGTETTVNVGKQSVKVTWVGELARDADMLLNLRIRENGSPYTFIAYSPKAFPQIIMHPNANVLTPAGDVYELIDGMVRGKPDGKNVPRSEDFKRGAELLRGVMKGQAYLAETNSPQSTIMYSQFAITVDRNERTPPEPQQPPKNRRAGPSP